MDNKRKNGTPQPKQAFYLVPKRPEFANTGEAPFFTMSPEPQTSLIGGGAPNTAKRK